MDARSDVDEETQNQRTELGGHQHLNARGILARTRCRHCPQSVPCPFGSFLSDRWRQSDFEDHKRAQQKLPWLMAENGNACTTYAYLSPTPGFFAPFYYCQCLWPYGQRWDIASAWATFSRLFLPDIFLVLLWVRAGSGALPRRPPSSQDAPSWSNMRSVILQETCHIGRFFVSKYVSLKKLKKIHIVWQKPTNVTNLKMWRLYVTKCHQKNFDWYKLGYVLRFGFGSERLSLTFHRNLWGFLLQYESPRDFL